MVPLSGLGVSLVASPSYHRINILKSPISKFPIYRTPNLKVPITLPVITEKDKNIMVQTGSSEASQGLNSFWPKVNEDVKTLTNNDFKQQELPLARIKKIMKLDDDVKMISAEAPVLFSKAAELFITELTLRAWIHTEDNKRRTLQRNDIAMAISKYDQFDFLIDIVPRDELKPQKARDDTASRPAASIPDQYYLQLAQQNQQALQQASQQPQTASISAGSLAGQQQAIQIVQGGAPIQAISVMPAAQIVQAAPQAQVAATPVAVTSSPSTAQQQITLQSLNMQQQQQAQQQQLAGIQIVQQIVGPNGEIQQIPLQLSAQQLQMIRMQLGAAGNGQQIVLQAAQQPGQQE